MLARVDDLTIYQNGRGIQDGVAQPHLFWTHNQEREGGQTYDVYRVTQLYLLRYLPQESRHDPAFLDQMRVALTGLYNQRRAAFDIVMLLAGIWEPEPVGILQLYGVTGLGSTLEDAHHHATLGAEALLGALASFTQVILEPLPEKYAGWLETAYARMQHATVVVGHPDARLAAKGGGREGPSESASAPPAELNTTGQQVELFLRAMAGRRQEFIAPVLASPAPRGWLVERLMQLADESSVIASLQTGSESIATGIALPLSLSANLGQSVASAFGRMRGASQGRSLTLAESRTHTVGRATTTGHTITDGAAHSVGFATSSGRSVSDSISHSTGSAQSSGTAHTEGSAHSVGAAHTTGRFSSTSSSAGFSGGVSQTVVDSSSQSAGGAFNVGVSASESAGHSEGASFSDSVGGSAGATHTESAGASDSRSYSLAGGQDVGLPGGIFSENLTATEGHTVGSTSGAADSLSTSVSTAHSEGGSVADTVGTSHGASVSGGVNWASGASHSVGTTTSSGWSYSSGSSSGSSTADTTSVSDTTSQSDTTSEGSSVSEGMTLSHSESHFSSATHSVSDTTSHSESFSTAHTRSEADSTGETLSRGLTAAYSDGLSVGRSLGVSQGVGVGMGAVPSFNLAQSYQWYDDQAIQLTALLRAYQEILRQATLEGAYYTDFYVLTPTESGAVLAETATRQAFQGSGTLVVTPVQTRHLSPEEQAYIITHARAWCPSTRIEKKRGSYEAYRDATLLLPSHLAAYMAPALFEEGAAVTVKEKAPPFAFYPDLTGDITWAYQYSVENSLARPTTAPVRLGEERLFHTAFAADSGFGKSVAAERLALETTAAWHTQTVVLDFGAGWRKLLNAAELRGHVQVWQLQPGARAPFRWNPWQVGKRMRPERQLPATCEIFKNAGRMGERQLGYMRRAAEKMWREAGVLTFNRSVQDDPVWGYVQENEWAVLAAAAAESGAPVRQPQANFRLADLSAPELQALAVYRSQVTGIPQWIKILREMLEGVPTVETRHRDGKPYTRTVMKGAMKQGSADYASLDGLLLRLEAFTMGQMAEMYGPGPDSLAVEALGLIGPERWGVAILEGGAEMDEYTKSVLMGLVAWHLYNDAVVRRRERINLGRDARLTQLYFEEANKILSGVDTGMADGQSRGTASTSALFQTMWRDGRKYGIYLHLMVQSPSELPAGIVSSCANLVIGKLSAAADRDVAQAALGWSEKGFTDEDYKRFISQMAVGYAILKLGYTADFTQTAPLLVRPLLVHLPEPSDDEIWRQYQGQYS